MVESGAIDIDLDESTTAFRLAFGYEWNDIVALEAGYSNLGEVDADVSIGRAEAEADGFEFAVVVRWPLAERFALAGRAGWLWWDGETRLAGLSAGESGGDALFGIGGEFMATDQFGITLGWSRYRLDDLDVDYASVGLRVRFGTSR